jgi:KilA-N domain
MFVFGSPISRQPNAWIRSKSTAGRVQYTAKKVRNSKYGASCGFGVIREGTGSLAIKKLTDTEICFTTVKGNSRSGPNQGTYVCQDWIVGYAGFLSTKFQAHVIDVFTSVINGYVKQVTEQVQTNSMRAKGTPERLHNKESNDLLVAACGLKGILPMKVQQGVNEGVLGMTATQYKKTYKIKEPFNDNLTVDQVYLKNLDIGFAAACIHFSPKPKLSNKEGHSIGIASGSYAREQFQSVSTAIYSRLSKD